MYIINQSGDQTIKLHSIKYVCYWSNQYKEATRLIASHPDWFDASGPVFHSDLDVLADLNRKFKAWRQSHPYEEIVDIYVDGDQKFGTFYSRHRGIEEYENILKAIEDGVRVYRIPKSNEEERKSGK